MKYSPFFFIIFVTQVNTLLNSEPPTHNQSPFTPHQTISHRISTSSFDDNDLSKKFSSLFFKSTTKEELKKIITPDIEILQKKLKQQLDLFSQLDTNITNTNSENILRAIGLSLKKENCLYHIMQLEKTIEQYQINEFFLRKEHQ